jgi:hypothetical protein
MNNPVNKVIIYVLGVFIANTKVSAAVCHNKDQIFLLCGFDLVLCVVNYVKLVHHAIKGSYYDLVPIFEQPHLLYGVDNFFLGFFADEIIVDTWKSHGRVDVGVLRT